MRFGFFTAASRSSPLPSGSQLLTATAILFAVFNVSALFYLLLSPSDPKALAPLQALPLGDAVESPAHASDNSRGISVSDRAAQPACLAWIGLRSGESLALAQKKLAASSLASTSWLVRAPAPAIYEAGLESTSLPQAQALAAKLRSVGVEPLSVSARFVSLARADSASMALRIAQAQAASVPGVKALAFESAPAQMRESLVMLPLLEGQTTLARQLASSISGSSLSPALCPQQALPLLK